MLSGFNTNVRHQGVLFHVQTEDSGRNHPHIITHLYYGGTILSSEKSDYREHLGAADLERVVRSLMEQQHSRMLRRLRRGELDALIGERLGADVLGDRADATGASGEAGPPLAAAGPAARRGRAFGEGAVAEKPLDEMVLEYLVEKARKRKPSRA